IPWANLEAAGLDQRLELAFALRTRAQIILHEDGLPIEQECPESRIGRHALEQVVEHGNEARVKRRARQEPFTVPMRVGDQMKNDGGHGRICGSSASLGRWTCATRRPRASSARTSPRACAWCSAPKLVLISGISISAATSVVITRKSPLAGPPLCSWPVEWR